MKKIFALFAFAISLVNTISAQESKDSTNFSIRLNPSRLFEGTFALSYEHTLCKDWTLDITALGTYGTKRGIGGLYFESQFASDFSGNYYSADMISGWGIMAMPKYFLISKRNLTGAYAAPYAMFRRVSLTGQTYTWEGEPSTVTRNVNIYSVGVTLGGKIALFKYYCIDFYVGGAFRLAKYDNDKGVTQFKQWTALDYSGVLPSAGISIGILK